jgi:putative endonuclease
MHYVYILKSKKDNNLYTGCTNNLKVRLEMHNKNKVPATHDRSPLILIYYEAYLNKYDAFIREKYLKTGWGRNRIKKSLHNYLTNKNFGG